MTDSPLDRLTAEYHSVAPMRASHSFMMSRARNCTTKT